MVKAAKNPYRKAKKHQADMASSRQSGKLIFWLILSVLGIGLITISLS